MKLLLLALAGFSSPVFAGDLLTFKKLENESGFVRVYLEPTKMKVDLSDNGKDVKNTIFYEKAKEEATLIDHSKKQFTVFNRQTLERMGGAMNKMKEAMANMPPQMQKMLREKMGAAQAATPLPPVRVKKMGSGEKVGKWKATRYEISQGKKAVSDTWTVPLQEVGVDKENFAIVKSMSESFGEIAKDFQSMMGAESAGPQAQLQSIGKIEGFPVKTVNRSKKSDSGFLLESAEKKTLSSSEFAVPSSYKEKSMAQM